MVLSVTIMLCSDLISLNYVGVCIDFRFFALMIMFARIYGL
jgi:hypothetical protein